MEKDFRIGRKKRHELSFPSFPSPGSQCGKRGHGCWGSACPEAKEMEGRGLCIWRGTLGSLMVEEGEEETAPRHLCALCPRKRDGERMAMWRGWHVQWQRRGSWEFCRRGSSCFGGRLVTLTKIFKLTKNIMGITEASFLTVVGRGKGRRNIEILDRNWRSTWTHGF